MRTVGIILSALILSGAVFTAEADARVRRGHAIVQTERGAYTVESRVERRRCSRTREAIITGPGGRQSSVYDQRQWNAQEGVYSHDRTREFANGDTRSVDMDAARVAPGVWNYNRDVTGRHGRTRSQSGTVTIERTP